MSATTKEPCVWKTHKEVCGTPYASPFTPPNLTDGEAKLLQELIYVETPVPEGSVPASVAARIVRKGKVTKARALESHYHFEEGEMETKVLPLCRTVRSIEDRQERHRISSCLSDMRARIFIFAQGEDPDSPRALAATRGASVFSLSAQLDSLLRASIRVLPHTDFPDTKRDELSHRCLVLAALVKLKLDPRPPTGFDAELITKSHLQLLEFLRPHLHFPGAMPERQLMTVTQPLARVLAPAHKLMTGARFTNEGGVAGFLCETGTLRG
ncbi:hypothetical protein JCM10449v2_003591 [Rhodotorula kratochvilovae]